MPRKAVFLDRDGTINVDVSYLDDPERFELYPGVGQGIRLLNEAGFLVVVITNQSGIARGYLDESTLDAIHIRMVTDLLEHDASIDAIYFCPHHPDDGCRCRKPATGMLERAVRDLDIDTQTSYMVGNHLLDVEAGRRMGMTTVLVPEAGTGVEKKVKDGDISPDHLASDFMEGVRWILAGEGADMEDGGA